MKRILFFIGALVAGGKERRFMELLTFLKNSGKYEMIVVTTGDNIHFPAFKQLEIPLKVIKKKKFLGVISFPYALLEIASEFQPDLIHTWGRMQTLYVLPTRMIKNIPLINGQITNASPNISLKNRFIDKLNFWQSSVILSNSFAGIASYKPPKGKYRVIYNGVNLNRFKNLTDQSVTKEKYNINTPLAVVMVATFSKNKDYERFFRIAKKILTIRNDVSFIGAGYYHKGKNSLYQRCLELADGHPNLIMTGLIYDVEDLVNACDIGVLISNKKVHGEGISNALIEYMALGLPVIANDAGGTKELIVPGENGVLITQETDEEIAMSITELLDHPEKRMKYGEAGQRKIKDCFTIQKMGENFLKLYEEVLNP
ncbi:MAG: glycosyltransferase family 4 protein [Cytophagales bacterium]|uniref:glycosyltransferase family 4 protein n=1 Tax=Cyclobacterium marinum TaxID=104 RepID=UPI0030D864BF|nr:glycosyltransferase family 4 protein [Cytophagales bacterium]|tara:strand:- start:17230 stop:18342 length:1113 start_codon:yes stop_codon:yes gene_type:complete